MYRKHFYKTALISSPIMVAFELSPLFFTNNQPYFYFLIGVFILTLITLIQWFFNIYLFSGNKKKNWGGKWEHYFLSYLFAFLTIALFMIFTTPIFSPPIFSSKDEIPPPVFPFINAATQNTIIIIIINSIINRSRKEQTDRELAILKIKHLEAEQQQLIQKLQPHFLFNALSTLKSLININTEQAEEYLVQLSDFLRYTVTSHANKMVELNEELKFMSDYIRLQQIRFGNSFFYEIQIPEHVQQSFLIPVYALQTLVENAIKHNAFTSAKPLYLSIVFKENCIVVQNNKISKLHENKNGMGLKNLNKRFLLIGGHPITIDNKQDFFSVTIKLIQKNKLC